MKINVTVTPPNIIKYPIHSHDTWELMCYLSGKGQLKTEKGDFDFGCGTIIAIPPGVKHGSCGEGYFSNICIHADFEMSENKIYYIPLGSNEQTSIFNIVKELYFDDKHNAVVPNLIMALKDLVCIDVNPELSGTEKVHRFISQNYMDAQLDIAEMIKETGYSDDFFRTQFKRRYDTTPRQYLEKLRLDYAVDLLETYKGAMQIKDIASLCGFNDELYFSRRFKKRYGISPKIYINGEEKNEKN